MHAFVAVADWHKTCSAMNIPLILSLSPTCVTVVSGSVYWSLGSVDTCTNRHVRLRMFVNNNTVHHIGRQRAPPETNNGPL